MLQAGPFSRPGEGGEASGIPRGVKKGRRGNAAPQAGYGV